LIEIDISIKQMAEIKHKLGTLNKKRLNKVVSKAANETAKQLRRTISDHVRKEYTVLLGATTKSMKIEKANASKPIAVLSAKGMKIPLLQFGVSHKKRIQTGSLDKKGNSLYHKVKVKKSSKMKQVVTAFIAKNYLIIRPRNAIGKKSHAPKNWLAFGPSMPEMIGSKKAWKTLSKDGNALLRKNLDKAIRDELEGYLK